MNTKLVMAGAILAVSVSLGIYFATAANEISSQTILDTGKTVIGQDIQYPSGSPLITSKIVTIPVGAETGPHIHEYPMFGPNNAEHSVPARVKR